MKSNFTFIRIESRMRNYFVFKNQSHYIGIRGQRVKAGLFLSRYICIAYTHACNYSLIC